MNPAGAIFGFSPHYIDHVAPLCALLDWPLIIDDPSIGEIIERFYPGLSLVSTPDPIGMGKWVSERFSHIVSCWPKELLKQSLGPYSFQPLWLPHGNSDKGQIHRRFSALQEETAILTYGQKMADFLLSEQVPISRMIRIGSFRKLYYEKTRAFYDAIGLGVSFSNPDQPTLLYAPTWNDIEGNGSFWMAFDTLAERLPPSINLLIKPHPNTVNKDAPQMERLIGKHSSGNLQFLLDFPPIYPLLARSSALLGDRSSIGYDFLHFNRPMLFLNPHDSPQGRDLLACGLSVRPDEVFQRNWNEDGERLSCERKAMAAYAFDEVPLEMLRSMLS